MNKRKIAFIICVNNEIYFEECKYYIDQLLVPEGYEIDVLAIREAESMCAAYNLGMQSTDAKYKIYMHQDVFICKKDFLQQMIDRFEKYPQVGMIGMMGGVRIPDSGVAFSSWNEGKVDVREPDMAYYLLTNDLQREDAIVAAVDGLLIATQYDIPWREDLFTDFDFYDVSQACEFRRNGYEVLVPYQKEPWVIHDSGFAKLGKYDRNREIFLREYAEFLTASEEDQIVYDSEWEELSTQLEQHIKGMVEKRAWQAAREALNLYHQNNYRSSGLEVLYIMSEIQNQESTAQVTSGFFDGLCSYTDMYQKYAKVRFLIRRMEKDIADENVSELEAMLAKNEVSSDAVYVMVCYTAIDKAKVLKDVAELYKKLGMGEAANRLKRLADALKTHARPVSYSKAVKKKPPCLFSVLMCVYNDTELLQRAVDSVLTQDERSLELLILDNSDTNRVKTWEMLCSIAETDQRVHIFQSSENVGWAKGAAELQQYADGIYMTFLAADDILLPGALAKVKKAVEEDEPDILWVGNKFLQYENGVLQELGESVCENGYFITTRHASNIKSVMEHTFYNSFFHFEKLTFLRKEGIDFFEPYYGDCAGMARALTRAEKMAILDEAVYGLTVNTSQSRGTFYWNGETHIFAPQWESIREACVKDGYFSFQELKYCAMAILKNENGNIISMAEGCKCVDKLMHPQIRTCKERFSQIRQILENETIQEMVQFYGRFEYENELMEAILKLLNTYQMQEMTEEDWLSKFIQAGCRRTETGWQRKTQVSVTEMHRLIECVTAVENVGMFGMGILINYLGQLPEEVLAQQVEAVQKVMGNYSVWKNAFVEKVWSCFQEEKLFEGNSKVELAAFCKYVIEN